MAHATARACCAASTLMTLATFGARPHRARCASTQLYTARLKYFAVASCSRNACKIRLRCRASVAWTFGLAPFCAVPGIQCTRASAAHQGVLKYRWCCFRMPSSCATAACLPRLPPPRPSCSCGCCRRTSGTHRRSARICCRTSGHGHLMPPPQLQWHALPARAGFPSACAARRRCPTCARSCAGR